MYKYDVALSFASKQEKFVEKVKFYLEAEGLEVFFFPNEQKHLMSQNPYECIYRVFQKESFVKVLFVTKEYQTSKWTQLEKRCAIRSTSDNPKRLIIVNFMQKNLDEELSKYIYIDGKRIYEDEIAAYIAERIRELGMMREKIEKRQAYIMNNHGIVAGDNAVFHKIRF